MADEIKMQEPLEGERKPIGEANKSDLSVAIDPSAAKPKVDQTPVNVLRGYVASGTHGSFLTPLSFIEYLPGAEIEELRLRAIIKLQPLKHVGFDRIQLTVYAVFVPNKRVLRNADSFHAQRNDLQTPLQVLPSIASYDRINVTAGPTAALTLANLYEHTLWRESIGYHYYGLPFGQISPGDVSKPYNALLARGYVAAWNDIFRDKKTTGPMREFDGNTATEAERMEIMGMGGGNRSIFEPDIQDDFPGRLRRVPTRKNYWNDWRPNVFANNNPVDNSSLRSHDVTQKMIDEYRQQASNANKTDQEVIAELGGVKQARENECQIIGRKTIDIDMAVQPATAESTQSTVMLGETGAISFTFIDEKITTRKFRHPKNGYIHYMYAITMPDGSLYSNTQNIEVLKLGWNDFYRQGTKEIKDAPLFLREVHGRFDNVVGETDRIIGWRHSSSEYFRHPTVVRGDFISDLPVRGGAPSDRRSNTIGFRSATMDGTAAINLPSTIDWTCLTTGRETTNLLSNGIDQTDERMRRLLLLDGGTLETTQFRLRTPQTFYLVGNVECAIRQPIDKAVARQFIKWGEE